MSEKKKSSEKKQEPDYLGDAILAVELFDKARLTKSADTDKLKEKAVRMIQSTNRVKGDGYISISKARAITQAIEQREKVMFLEEQERKQKNR